MTSKNAWYCLRLELLRETGEPHYGRFIKEALQSLFPGKFNAHPPVLPPSEFLFVIITDNHLKHFRPVAKELQRQNHSFSIIYTNDALLEKYGAEWPGLSFSIQAWVSQWLYFRAVLFQTALFFANLFSTARKKAVIIRFVKSAYLIHQTMIRLLSGTPQKVVLFKAEAYQANAVLTACKHLKTPSFAIQHGLIGDTDQVANLAVDQYLVWSDFFKNRLDHWQAGCEVRVVGNAAYDGVFQEVAASDVQTSEQAPFRVLVLPSAGFSHTPVYQVHLLLTAVLEFAKNHPSALVTVKPHPADHSEIVRHFLAPHVAVFPNLLLLDRFDTIPFKNHHVVAINNSGAGLEACIWERPIVVFSPSWEAVMVKQYVESGVAEFADSPHMFAEKIAEIKNHYADYQEKCRAFTQTQLAYQGQAAEKIVEALTC